MSTFSYIKITVFSLLLFFGYSCKKDNEEVIIENKLEISFKGYYEEINGFPYVDDVYTNIQFSRYTEDISPDETVEILQIIAKSSDTDKFVRFEVYPDSLGEHVIYNEIFVFKSTGGASYYPHELYFNVTKNDEIGFIAEFNGKLKHYNQYDDYYIYMNI